MPSTFENCVAKPELKPNRNPIREVTTSTAAGPRRARVLGGAELDVQGRKGTFDCLELPDGTQPLLGVIPLESLGLEPDLVRGQLRLLPDGPDETYITVL